MAQTKAPKTKHVPQRTCIACRRSDAKRGLIRIVRDADGRVAVDLSGKRNGRGAYLCHDPTCWQQAVKRRALERALRVEQLNADDRASLLAFAAALPPRDGPEPDVERSQMQSLAPAKLTTTETHSQGQKGN
jgi:predicted RNA-binding protein YlxR (DUF448 family)